MKCRKGETPLLSACDVYSGKRETMLVNEFDVDSWKGETLLEFDVDWKRRDIARF